MMLRAPTLATVKGIDVCYDVNTAATTDVYPAAQQTPRSLARPCTQHYCHHNDDCGDACGYYCDDDGEW